MREFMNITKALSDPTRIRVLLALRERELCACQITELFGLAQSTMSKHFYLLKQAGLVDCRKEGRWVYYALPGGAASSVVREALAWVERSLARDSVIADDQKRLKQVLKCDPADLCRKQCTK
ncbi:MAG: ArsR/SmtB family transcription factor [Limisphaerales bacterium]|jgi:ArsR family transcriptional regulator